MEILLRMFTDFFMLIWLQTPKCFSYVGWVLGELPKLHMWAPEDCWWLLDCARWNWKYIPTVWRSPLPPYDKWTHKLLHWLMWLVRVINLVSSFQVPRHFHLHPNFWTWNHLHVCSSFSRQERNLRVLHDCFCHAFILMVSWTLPFPSKTSTPKEWVAQRGTRGVGRPLAMLNLASLQSQAVGHGQHAPNGWRYELDTRKGVWKSTEMHTNGWYET